MNGYWRGADVLGAADEKIVVHVHTPMWQQVAMVFGFAASIATLWAVFRRDR